jgi:hypothetical protein
MRARSVGVRMNAAEHSFNRPNAFVGKLVPPARLLGIALLPDLDDPPRRSIDKVVEITSNVRRCVPKVLKLPVELLAIQTGATEGTRNAAGAEATRSVEDVRSHAGAWERGE